MESGTPHDADERAGLPPTDRVVAIVELLSRQSEPSSVASIASRLESNRSTVTSILLALERSGWVARQPDRRYVLGAGLLGVAEAVPESLPLPERFSEALGELAHRAGCGASLALVGSSEMTFLSVVRGRGRLPAGVGVGVRLPLTAPSSDARKIQAMTRCRTWSRQAWAVMATPLVSRGYWDLHSQ